MPVDASLDKRDFGGDLAEVVGDGEQVRDYGRLDLEPKRLTVSNRHILHEEAEGEALAAVRGVRAKLTPHGVEDDDRAASVGATKLRLQCLGVLIAGDVVGHIGGELGVACDRDGDRLHSRVRAGLQEILLEIESSDAVQRGDIEYGHGRGDVGDERRVGRRRAGRWRRRWSWRRAGGGGLGGGGLRVAKEGGRRR